MDADTTPIWLETQARLSLRRLLPRLEAQYVSEANAAEWASFRTRLETHFEKLFRVLVHLYGGRYDFFYHLESILAAAARLWLARPAELKALDERRETNPGWFHSQEMLGGVCYVDLFAGNLAGIRARIPYFKELGLTYLHLMPLFACPAGENDGGYAVSSYREVNPALGTMAGLSDLAAELRRQNISLVLDFVFNHTSNEHEWARRGPGRRSRVPGLLLHVSRPGDAGRLREEPARDLPRCPAGQLHIHVRCPPLGLDHLQQLPVGSEICESRRFSGDA